MCITVVRVCTKPLTNVLNLIGDVHQVHQVHHAQRSSFLGKGFGGILAVHYIRCQNWILSTKWRVNRDQRLHNSFLAGEAADTSHFVALVLLARASGLIERWAKFKAKPS